jgi:hypothetical protein
VKRFALPPAFVYVEVAPPNMVRPEVVEYPPIVVEESERRPELKSVFVLKVFDPVNVLFLYVVGTVVEDCW